MGEVQVRWGQREHGQRGLTRARNELDGELHGVLLDVVWIEGKKLHGHSVITLLMQERDRALELQRGQLQLHVFAPAPHSFIQSQHTRTLSHGRVYQWCALSIRVCS